MFETPEAHKISRDGRQEAETCFDATYQDRFGLHLSAFAATMTESRVTAAGKVPDMAECQIHRHTPKTAVRNASEVSVILDHFKLAH